MRFTYCYKTPDNVRHVAEIAAPGRDEAFAALRAQGIRPIKVTAVEDAPRVRRRALRAAGWTALAAALALLAWWAGRRAGGGDAYRVMTPQGPVTLAVARPLARQRIPGDRARIEDFPTNLFAFALERALARFAEPGRPTPPPDPGAFAGDPAACLDAPVRIASDDFTEHVDLKRIVAGMKREMRAYLAGGGTPEGYRAELERRQRLEQSYRERAAERLAALVAEAGKAPDKAEAAYAYWLRANARLRSMGIHEIPLPDALRPCQDAQDLDP